MKKLRVVALSLSLLIILLAFASCSAAYDGEPKTFTKEGVLSITLTDQFEQSSVLGTFLSAESKSLFGKVVFGASYVQNPSGLTVKYVVAELIDQARKSGYDIVETSEEHFEFTKEIEGTLMYSYDIVMKNRGKTYLFEFACKESQMEKYRPYFIEWASTIEFE